jgi:transcription antitermination factor NusG
VNCTSPAGIDANARWLAVWTRSQCEQKVELGLRRKRFEVFLPRVRMPSARRDRRVVLERPLFPGYLFVRLPHAAECYLRVANTDGVVRILGESWESLHRIADADVEAVRRMVTAGEGARAIPWMRIGDRARIVAGPLIGLEGLVQKRLAGRTTFVVSIDILQRSVAVEVSADDLAPA